MSIAEILAGKSDELIAVGCDTLVRDAVERLAANKIGAVPVLRDGRVAGILSERDIIQCLSSDGAAILDWKAERVMTAPAITATRDISALAALSMMTQRRIRHLPVVEGDDVIGIVSIGDLVAYRVNRIQQEAEAMRAYIQSA